MPCINQSDYTHCHNQVSSSVHKIWLSNVDCQRKNQNIVINMRHHPCCRNNTLYYEWSITAVRTVHNKKPDNVILDNTIKAAHSEDTGIPNIRSNITEKLQVYTDLKHGLTNIWQLNALQQYHSTLSNKVHDFLRNIKFCVFIFSTTFFRNFSNSVKNSATYCHNCISVCM